MHDRKSKIIFWKLSRSTSEATRKFNFNPGMKNRPGFPSRPGADPWLEVALKFTGTRPEIHRKLSGSDLEKISHNKFNIIYDIL